MAEQDALEKAVIEKLMTVMDPETNTDVVRMRLIQDIQIDAAGKITYVFRPSSPLCPIAVPLALSIIQAIREVPGVTGQSIKVVDYVQAEQLNVILNSVVEDF
jgi:metal-sulfur cluster biosynthetic enzyme